jgi:phage terminase small subunit
MADNPISNNLARQGIDAQLSNQEAELVRNFIASDDWEQSALAAGYAESTAKMAKYWATQRPAILVAIHLETARRVQTEAPAAVDTIVKIRKGEITEGAKVRLDAAKAVLDRAGHIAPRARALGDAGEKTLGEMSLDELKATQERLNSELAARAKTVSAPPGPIIDSQAIDLIG